MALSSEVGEVLVVPSGGVFISYRHADAAPYARLLKFQLSDRFPDVRVFMDVDAIDPGLEFADVIREALDSCAVLVVLIGHQWTTLTDEQGRRRLDDPDDYVRFEVQTGLERDVRVIPVLVDGARPPRQEQLPAELGKLAQLNALELSYNRYEHDAGRLLDLIQRVLAAASSTGIAPDSDLIDRPEYIDRLRELIDAGRSVICIWGEPGTGKSTLAQQFSRRLGRDAPVPFIRCAPMTTAMTPDAEIFRQDLANALAAEGVDSTRLSPETWFSRLCEQLAGQPRSGAVVLDNIETDEWIAQAVRAQPKIPVIMTMRKRPQNPGIACEELGNFTEPQACDFIKRQLPGEDDKDVQDLAHILNCRPLALEHAVLFVREAPDVSLKTLVHGLATKMTDTLKAVTPAEELERNLVSLYQLIVASLEHDEDARAVLDSFLAVIGGTGTGAAEVLYLFMQSEAGGSHDRLHFRSGLRELERRGLVHEQQGLMHRQLDDGGSAEQTTNELVMHALTYSILRDLRGTGPLEIESRYWDFVLSGGHEALPEDETNEYEHAYLALLQWALQVASSSLPLGWASFVCADERT